MKIITSVFLLFSLLFSPVFAQETTINGFAELAKNSAVYAYEVSDGITEQLTLLSESNGNEIGNFNLKIPIKQTKLLLICTSNAKTKIWVDPNQEYKLTFLHPDTTVTQNGFVRFWESRITCKSDATTNALIGKINTEIASFISINAYEYLLLKSNSNKSSIKRIQDKNPESDLVKFNEQQDSTQKAQSKFRDSLTAFEAKLYTDWKSEIKSNSFIENYLFCKLSSLKLLTLIDDSYNQMASRIDLNNPAFCEWVQNYSSHYLNQNLNTIGQQQLEQKLQNSKSSEEIINLLSPDSLSTLALEELLFLTALRNKYYSRDWSTSFINHLKNIVFNSTKFEETRTLSNNMESEFQINSRSLLNDFILMDEQGNEWIFSDKCDRNMYLYFFNSSKSSQRDLTLLNQLALKYQNDFSIVAIGMQSSYEDYQKALQPLKLNNITTLFGGNNYRLIDELGIESAPFAIQTNNKKKISFKYTPLPSEGIQLKWEEILRKNKK
jgi:hypothetical protein